MFLFQETMFSPQKMAFLREDKILWRLLPAFSPFLSIQSCLKLSNTAVTTTTAAVFGLGMAGRVVVEGAPYPRGLLVEAYVPASSQT